jgi:DNA-directed RNA polymerase beta' subunit
MSINNFAAIQIGLASPEMIRTWSRGEVKKPETINYRSQKPERDGLFCERIFGPSKDWECYCGKYKKVRYKGVVCDRCGVEVTKSSVRRERMGHIELAAPVAHIWYLRGIPSRMSLLLGITPKNLEEVVYFVSWVVTDPGATNLQFKQILSEQEYRNYSRRYGLGSFVAKTGAEAVKELLERVDLVKEHAEVIEDLKEAQGDKRKKLIKRLETIDAFRNSSNQPEWMVLSILPVIPPDLRPMLQLDGGRFATSDLNDLYRRVITRNNRLRKLIDMGTPAIIVQNEKRMLQEAVDALIDNGRRSKPITGAGGRALKSLSHSLKGKQGRFRQNLLGKRVDFSGRSVIAVGPDLKMFECGIPREMAIQLFKPFVINEIVNRQISSNPKSAEKLIERQDPRVWDIVEDVIADHPVLLNRAPTLHRLGIQAFKPKLVEGRAIRLHPLVTPAFNADFDGDQMAVHVPLSETSRAEAEVLMLGSNNILGPKDGKPIVTPSQDMVMGNFYLNMEERAQEFFAKADLLDSLGDAENAAMWRRFGENEGHVYRDVNEAILAYENKEIHLHTRILVRASSLHKTGFSAAQNRGYLISTVGKLIFNEMMPADFPYLNEVTKENFIATPTRYFVAQGENVKEVVAKLELSKDYKKKDLGTIISEVFNRYGTEKTSEILDQIKDNGFKYSTIAGMTVALSDIIVSPNTDRLVEEGKVQEARLMELRQRGRLTPREWERHVTILWDRIKSEIGKDLEAALPRKNPINMMKTSGARGNASHFTQLAGTRGLMGKPFKAATSGDTLQQYESEDVTKNRDPLIEKVVELIEWGTLNNHLTSQDLANLEAIEGTTERQEALMNLAQSFVDRKKKEGLDDILRKATASRQKQSLIFELLKEESKEILGALKASELKSLKQVTDLKEKAQTLRSFSRSLVESNRVSEDVLQKAEISRQLRTTIVELLSKESAMIVDLLSADQKRELQSLNRSKNLDGLRSFANDLMGSDGLNLKKVQQAHMLLLIPEFLKRHLEKESSFIKNVAAQRDLDGLRLKRTNRDEYINVLAEHVVDENRVTMSMLQKLESDIRKEKSSLLAEHLAIQTPEIVELLSEDDLIILKNIRGKKQRSEELKPMIEALLRDARLDDDRLQKAELRKVILEGLKNQDAFVMEILSEDERIQVEDTKDKKLKADQHKAISDAIIADERFTAIQLDEFLQLKAMVNKTVAYLEQNAREILALIEEVYDVDQLDKKQYGAIALELIQAEKIDEAFLERLDQKQLIIEMLINEAAEVKAILNPIQTEILLEAKGKAMDLIRGVADTLLEEGKVTPELVTRYQRRELISKARKLIQSDSERIRQYLNADELAQLKQNEADLNKAFQELAKKLVDTNKISYQRFLEVKDNEITYTPETMGTEIRDAVKVEALRERKYATSIFEVPIYSSFRKGLNVSEFFISTHGVRKGLTDTALKTAESGYLTRRLVDVAQDVLISEDDCGTDRAVWVEDIIDRKTNTVIESLYDRVVGRYVKEDVVDPTTKEVLIASDELATDELSRRIVAAGIQRVAIRNVFSCEAIYGVCKKCYGTNMATGKVAEIGEAVGIMAAQSIGEPGTQLTMRTFHTGGVAAAEGGDITQGLPRVEELFEARRPKKPALLAKISGTITTIEGVDPNIYSYLLSVVNSEENKYKKIRDLDSFKAGEASDESRGNKDLLMRIVITNEKESVEHFASLTQHIRPWIKVGVEIEAGDKLTEDHIDPKELLEVGGVTSVQNYILKEVKKVYQSQGIEISDKHIEVMIKQMLRKVVVTDPKDTSLSAGVQISLPNITNMNRSVLLSGKRPATFKPVLLGISKSSVETDSFLSAASFQETTKVLTDAAIKGKVDRLLGLKENVIIGKKIPAGTGSSAERESSVRITAMAAKMKQARDELNQRLLEEQTLPLEMVREAREEDNDF